MNLSDALPCRILYLLTTLLFCWVHVSAQNANEPLHAADGNMREMISNIIIPPKPGSPFTAIVHLEWTRQLPDGSTFTLRNHRLIMRDGQGRIFQERRQLTPDGDNEQTYLPRVELSDPVKHIKYFCYMAERTCELRDYYMSVSLPTATVGPHDSEETQDFTAENLGKDAMEGLEVIGTRETYALKPAQADRQPTLTLTKEFWYSPQLDLNLVVKRLDPLHGVQNLRVSDINLGEPESAMFSLPKGFKIVDARHSVAASKTPAGP
jgi:hypothetical protein